MRLESHQETATISITPTIIMNVLSLMPSVAVEEKGELCMKSFLWSIVSFSILLGVAGGAQAQCPRSSRAALSDLAAAVLSNIETTPGALANSPVAQPYLLSTCNRFDSVRIEGPSIYSAARDLIAQADYEVDMAFYKWDDESYAATLVGDGLILAQARHSPSNPLLVRIVIDDVEELSLSRSVNNLWDSQKNWVSRGLDASRFVFQFATCPRFSFLSANLHDKFMVVDARYVLVTGANLEKAHDPYWPWHDSGYVLEGGAGRSALSAFEHTWINDSIHWECHHTGFLDFDCDKLPFHYPQPSRPWLPAFGSQSPGNVPVLAVGRVKKTTIPPNNDTNNPQDIAWLTVMDRATSRIHIESPNLNDDAFRDAVVRAVGRGVNVQLIAALGFNQTNSDLPSQGGDNEEVVGDLRQRIRAASPQYQDRFEVRWYSQTGMEPINGNGFQANHTKYMSVDDRVVVVGSGNMETPAWNYSHEFNILIDDAAVTSGTEGSLFLRDWGTSIGSYLELYEGNSGTQNLVCPFSVTYNRNTRLSDTGYCSNDETRSAMLYDVPAGRVFRFYDDGSSLYQDDDWTEIIVKRPLRRKYIDSYEASYEDADVRVIYHRDNGLDGKVSAVEAASTPAGAVLDLYEGNNATQNLVCSNRVTGPRTINLTQDPYCENDEARSLKLYDFPPDKAIFLYDDSGGSTGDDWTVIVPKRLITEATVGTFESSSENADMKVCHFHRDNLDGKVSRVRIGPVSEANGICTVTPACNCGEGSCTPVQAAYISHFTGLGCTGEEYYYTPYFGSDGVRRSWNGTGCVGTQLRTVTNRSWKNSSGVCSDSWPAGNTLSGFVRVYR